jgi:hypothetical protein
MLQCLFSCSWGKAISQLEQMETLAMPWQHCSNPESEKVWLQDGIALQRPNCMFGAILPG